MNRTITLLGLGFAPVAGNITIELDGVQVFSGPVQTDTEHPLNPRGGSAAAEIYSWQEDVNFSGAKSLKIKVNSGDFLYQGAFSTHMPVARKNNPGVYFSSGQNGPVPCFMQNTQFGVSRDPNSDVFIDGIAQSKLVLNPNEALGPWFWPLHEGSELTCNLNISAGLASPIYTDGDNILSTVNLTGDGTTKKWEIANPLDVNYPAKNYKVYVDNVLHPFPPRLTRPSGAQSTVFFNSDKWYVSFPFVPAAGAQIKIDICEDWDHTKSIYADFE